MSSATLPLPNSSDRQTDKTGGDRVSTKVSRATIGRIPLYLQYLKKADPTLENISATALAKALDLGEVQVRKDLAAVSGAGRPKTGYQVRELIASLDAFICADRRGTVVIVGAGKLGRALLDYGGFAEYGSEIIAAFDIAVDVPEQSHNGLPIYPLDRLEGFCREHPAKIGIITVPADQAQSVCDRLLGCGVRAIWCFAPCKLTVPEDFPVQYENMALSLAYLNNRINEEGN